MAIFSSTVSLLTPFRSDKDSDTRNGGVCVYFKESLPIRERCDLEVLPKTIVAVIKLDKKQVFVSYRHPNMPNDEFVQMSRFEKTMNLYGKKIPLFLSYAGILMQDLHCSGKAILKTMRGRLFDNSLISNHLEQLIDESTHVRNDGSQSCRDLICIDQPFTLLETDVFLSSRIPIPSTILYMVLST